MTSLASLVSAYTRTPTATAWLNNQRWYGIQKLGFRQRFGESISTGTMEGRAPPVTPQVGMSVRWTWGYNGYEVAGFTGEVSDVTDFSYPDRFSIACKDVLWRADKSNQVLQTSPLNSILASAGAKYLLTHYGGIPSSRLSIPSLPASGAAWAGSEWTLGILTPVQWGDTDTNSGGTTALKATVEICVCLGYWLYADASGIIRAKQMERRPSTSAREVFRRAVNLLIQGAPERRQSYDSVFNQVSVRGANTGVDGAQLYDQWRTTSPLLPSGIYRDFAFSSILLEYENAADAGAASVTSVAKRMLNVQSRIPDVVPLRAKADPSRKVGDTVGLIDTGVLLAAQKNYFIYQIDRTLDLQAGAFDDSLSLDGGTGSTGFTTVPPPDASFSWSLMAETLDGTAVVEVALDGSGSNSPTGEIVSWAWSTATTTYGSTPSSATGEHAQFIFALTDSPAEITLTVTDTTSKTGSFTASIDLTGADIRPPLLEVVSAAAGAAWYVTPDGGGAWNIETTNGDAIAVGTIGAGADDRAVGTGGTYGLLATRGTGGVGLRQTLDTLQTASTNLVAAGGAITSNIWVNEANPARVWFAVGTAVYRSLDGGITKVAMHAAPASVSWIMEDPELDDSVFLLAGADMLNATDPTVGWAILYAGPVGATARQFVRSRDGQVTWICYTGAPSGQALQRVETGALADFSATDVRSLALDRQASSLLATVYAVTGDDPAQIWQFDGLTGLSAAQSTQTFPGGATVQHMLTSRLFDVIYAADFDSIALGQGALRKFFPLMDQLLIWKQLASGQQGHMLGLGGAVSGIIELVLLPFGASGAQDKIWHRASGAWTGLTPPIAGAYWFWIAASPFAPDSWLLMGNTSNDNTNFTASGGVVQTNSGGHSPFWLTTDAGATWTALSVPDDGGTAPFTLNNAEWSATGGYFLQGYTGIAGGSPDPTAITRVWRGSGTTVSAAQTISPYIGSGGLAGGDGDVLVLPYESTSPQYKTRVVDSGGSSSTPSGSAPPRLGAADARVLTRHVAALTPSGGALYGASDYRAAQPSLLASLTSAVAVAWGGEVVYVTDAGDIASVTDPFGTSVLATVYSDGVHYDFIRSDRQSQSMVAAAGSDGGGVRFVVWDGTRWGVLAGPGATVYTAVGRHEVIVRGV